MAAARRGSARTEALPNGAVLITLPMQHARHAAISIGVRVGSRYEPARLAGISHFLEHMLFRGTAEHPTSYAQNFAFESLGGTLDAATSAETTVFTASVPHDAAPDAIALIAEMFREPVMASLELERNVVREELLDALDEDDQLIDPDELAARALFGAHPLGRSIGGTVQSLAAIQDRDLRSWHRQHYVGANLVVVIAGSFPARTRAAVVRELGQLPRGERSRAPSAAGHAAAERTTLVHTTGSQLDLRVAFRVPGATDPRWMALTMLARVLDDGMSARVFRTLVEDRGLAYEAFGDLDPYADVSMLALGASCRPESADEAVRTLLWLADGARGPLAQGELERVRTRALFELELARDQPESMADMLLGAELHGEEESIDELSLRARLVTAEDLVDVGTAIFRPDALALVAVGRMSAPIESAIRKAARSFR